METVTETKAELSTKQIAAAAKRKRKGIFRFLCSDGWLATQKYLDRGPIQHPKRTALTHEEILKRTQEKKEQL